MSNSSKNGLSKIDGGMKRMGATDMNQSLPKINVNTSKGGMTDPDSWRSHLPDLGANKPKGGLVLGEVDVEKGLVDIRAAAISPVDKLLRQAKQLIQEKKYKEAFAILAKALKECPDSPEARYLAGLCCYKLDSDWSALRALHPLIGQSLDSKLATRVGALRDSIRQRMQPKMITLAMSPKGEDELTEAVNKLGEAARLDPEVELYHYLYAGCLMTANQLDEALAAVDMALQVSQVTNPTNLEGLRHHILERQLDELLQPALRLYRKQEYAQARTSLSRLSDVHRKMQLCVTFDGYLKKLQGGLLSFLSKGTPATIDPPGSREEADALYFFLVRPELDVAKALLAQARFQEADNALQAALKYTPRFAYVNFLRAMCLYEGFFLSIHLGQAPALEDFIAGLETALVHARVGVTDPEIGSAPDLLQAIEQMLTMLKEMRGDAAEAQAVNGIIDEFEAARQIASGGISSIAQIDRIIAALRAVEKKLPSVRKKVTSPQGRGVLDQLAQAIQGDLGQLVPMRTTFGEEELIGPLFQQFNETMERLERQGGISGPQEFQRLKTFFQGLKKQVESALPKVRDAENRSNVSKLLDAIKGILNQMGA